MKKSLQSIVLLLAALVVPVAANAQGYGDVNGDGEVTVADINVVIDVILGRAPSSSVVDVNGDGEVTIADINAVIDVIVGNPTPPPGPGGDIDIPEEILAKLKDSGMNIYYGDNPPMVNGTFVMEPIDSVLIGPFNIWLPYGDEEEGYMVEFDVIKKLIISFQNQEDGLISLLCVPFYDTEDYDPDEITVFEDMAIIGNGNKFTISMYFTMDFLFPGEEIGLVFSGEISGQNIKNLQMASVDIIPDVNGRQTFIAILSDHDGISYRTNWEPDDDDFAPNTETPTSFINTPTMKRIIRSQLNK